MIHIFKKAGWALAALLLMIPALSSCDSIIATSLEGTWEGDMYFTSYYDGREYYSNYSEVEFLTDPMSFKSGHGYWVDYYSSAPWDYVANHMTWTVRDRVIYIHLVEDRYDFEIRNYRLDDYKFYGYVFYDGEERSFELYHTSSPNWDEYDYGYGYGYGYNSGYGPYYSPSRSNTEADSIPIPIRRMRPANVSIPLTK